MSYQGKKVVGIWIDHKQAFVIGTADRKNNGEFSVLQKFASKHHADHSSSEDAHHNKLAQEIRHLYAEVAGHIKSDDAIFITGPGTAQEEFKNFLSDDQHFHAAEIKIGTSDHPTENQMIAEVRKHFV